jgi:hypothetical protein
MNPEKLTIGPFALTERDHDWHACWTGRPELWGSGPTVDSAIGSVVRSHPELVGRLDPDRVVGDDYDPRVEAVGGRHSDPAQAAVMHATIYVGDQLARIADVLEKTLDAERGVFRVASGF